MNLSRHLPALLLGVALGASGSAVFWRSGGDQAASSGAPPSSLPGSSSSLSKSAPPSDHPLKRRSPAAKPALVESLKKLEKSPHPLLRSAELTQLGYDAAGADMNHAITQLDAIRDRAGKLAFLKGVFTRVAEDKSPYEAIQRVKRLSRHLEPEGYKALISQWTGHEMSAQASFQDIYRTLLSNKDISQEIKQAWLQAYRDHTSRSQMLAEYAGSLVGRSSEDALALGQEFSGWERQEFYHTLTQRWMLDDPEAAWTWITDHPGELTSNTVASALDLWTQKDPQAALSAFENLTEPADRIAGAASLARYKASMEGTEASLAWADSLPTAAEQDAAHDAIYVATPRGIGAVLDKLHDSLIIRDTLPGTPAQLAGLQKGDRIVEVDPGDGQLRSLSHSQGLTDAINLIRGEPGAPLRLRILRSGGESEIIDLNRQQLIFEGGQPWPGNRSR